LQHLIILSFDFLVYCLLVFIYLVWNTTTISWPRLGITTCSIPAATTQPSSLTYPWPTTQWKYQWLLSMKDSYQCQCLAWARVAHAQHLLMGQFLVPCNQPTCPTQPSLLIPLSNPSRAPGGSGHFITAVINSCVVVDYKVLSTIIDNTY